MIKSRNSLAAQWLGLSTFSAVTQVSSLVRELRSHKPHGEAKKKKKNKKIKICLEVSRNFYKGQKNQT